MVYHNLTSTTWLGKYRHNSQFKAELSMKSNMYCKQTVSKLHNTHLVFQPSLQIFKVSSFYINNSSTGVNENVLSEQLKDQIKV